ACGVLRRFGRRLCSGDHADWPKTGPVRAWRPRSCHRRSPILTNPKRLPRPNCRSQPSADNPPAARLDLRREAKREAAWTGRLRERRQQSNSGNLQEGSATRTFWLIKQFMMRKKRTRRGFIIFFGWRTLTRQRPETPVNTVCPSCRQQSSIVPMQGRDWFTLFFIPVLPISSAKQFVKCTSCQTCFDMDIEQFRRKAAMPDERAWQQCIRLYNTLRESPKDSVLLNRLLEMYAGMREFEEGLAAGRHFPDALNDSAQCLT